MKLGFARTIRTLTLAATFAIFLAVATGFPHSERHAQRNGVAAQKKVNFELTTDPSPAHKGANTVRVNLTDAAGQSISSADVTTTFYMPAMPSMGMAAMKTVVKGTDKGDGLYEGTGELASAGRGKSQSQLVKRVKLSARRGSRSKQRGDVNRPRPPQSASSAATTVR